MFKKTQSFKDLFDSLMYCLVLCSIRQQHLTNMGTWLWYSKIYLHPIRTKSITFHANVPGTALSPDIVQVILYVYIAQSYTL